MDMEAGIEHLGRKTTENVDLMIVVVEPSKKSLLTAKRIKKLANDLNIPNIYAVINKVRDSREKEVFKKIFDKEIDIPILKYIPYSEEIIYMDMMGKPIDLDSDIGKEMEELFNRIIELKKDLK